jgi:hypothetical protein
MTSTDVLSYFARTAEEGIEQSWVKALLITV